jgi:transposase InsO family protein
MPCCSLFLHLPGSSATYTWTWWATLPASEEGHNHLLTVMDRATRWPETFPLKATTVSTCVDTLVNGWISRYGIPEDVTTDRGPQFMSEVWSLLCCQLGIRHRRTTAYHPQANGLVE